MLFLLYEEKHPQALLHAQVEESTPRPLTCPGGGEHPQAPLRAQVEENIPRPFLCPGGGEQPQGPWQVQVVLISFWLTVAILRISAFPYRDIYLSYPETSGWRS